MPPDRVPSRAASSRPEPGVAGRANPAQKDGPTPRPAGDNGRPTRRRKRRAIDRPGLIKRPDEPLFLMVLVVVSLLLVILLAIALANPPVRPASREAVTLRHSTENWRRLHTQTLHDLSNDPNISGTPGPRKPDPTPTQASTDLSLEASTTPASRASRTPSTSRKPQSPRRIPFIFVPMDSAGEPVTDRPPAVVWLHRWVFDGFGVEVLDLYIGLPGLDPVNSPPNRLAIRARWLSAVFTIAGVGLIGWTGFCIGRLATGSLALTVAATCPPVIWLGFHATDDAAKMAAIAWCTATGVWAMRPLRPQAAALRQITGWALCGFGLGSGVLIGGPGLALLAWTLLFIPLMICPNRWHHLTGFLAASGIGLLLQTPWLLAMYYRDHADGAAWFRTWVPEAADLSGSLQQAFGADFLTGMLMLSPWLLWILAAFGQATSTSSRQMRPRLLIGTCWCVATLVIVGLSTPDHTPGQRVTLAWPALAILIAQGFRRFNELSSEGRHARLWLILRWIHLPALIAGSALLGFICHQPPWFGPINPSLSDWVKATHPGYAVAGAVMAFLAALIAARYLTGNHPGRMLVAYTAWIYIFMAVLAAPVTQSNAMRSLRVPAEPPAPLPAPPPQGPPQGPLQMPPQVSLETTDTSAMPPGAAWLDKPDPPTNQSLSVLPAAPNKPPAGSNLFVAAGSATRPTPR